MKKTLSVIISAVVVASLLLSPLAAYADFSNFVYSNNYSSGQFQDVSEADWFSRYIEDSCNFGFVRGKNETTFDPGGLLTLGESVTLAARLRSIFHTGKADFAESEPYYKTYADYAVLHGIFNGKGNYAAPVTREQFAALMYNALPYSAFPVLNDISDNGICDVASDAAVYALYRAGILTGSDRFGTFSANSNITRAEACAVMVRLADPLSRASVQLPKYIPAEIIFQRSADAVFLIETFDIDGKSIRTGSGFFISDSGLAATGLHVIENAASAAITLYNGENYPLRGVLAVSEEYNLAILSVDSEKGGFSYLQLADSDLIEIGGAAYAIGSPLGLHNTISEGIISFSSREVSFETFIQFTAPISFGSGGGPVLNSLGQVVGVASSSFTSGQNLNLAIPVNYLKKLEPGPLVPFKDRLWTGYADENDDE